VIYITTRKPHAHCEENRCPNEAQGRFTRREAHSTPADRRFQIRQEHFSQLFAVLNLRRKNAFAEHIIMSFMSKAAQAQLAITLVTRTICFNPRLRLRMPYYVSSEHQQRKIILLTQSGGAVKPRRL
jgi:ABC-type lipoprotein export system ATPase subunit